MKYYRRIRIFTFISSPKDSYITFICFFLQRRQRIVCVCVWKKTSKKKKCTCHFLFCIFSYARKHVLAHASKALLICYLCEQIPACTVAKVLANNVLIYIYEDSVCWNIKSDLKGKIIIPVAQIMMSYITRHVLITETRWGYMYIRIVTDDGGHPVVVCLTNFFASILKTFYKLVGWHFWGFMRWERNLSSISVEQW